MMMRPVSSWFIEAAMMSGVLPTNHRGRPAPYRFEYVQAVRMFELWLRRRGKPSRDLVAQFLRTELAALEEAGVRVAPFHAFVE